MPTFFERMQELEDMEPELSINDIELIEKYYNCLFSILNILKENPVFIMISQQPDLYDILLKKFDETKKTLNEYHSNQIKNKRF